MNFPHYLTSILLSCTAGALFAMATLPAARAATLVTYEGGVAVGPANFDPSAVPANLTATPISQPATALLFTSILFTAPTYPGQGVVLQTTTIDATAGRPAGATPADSEYILFTLSLDSGFQMSLDQFSFKAARGGSSAGRGYDLRSSLDDYQNTLATSNIATQRSEGFSNISITLGTEFDNLEAPVTFRIYVYSTGTGSSIEFDDITVDGSLAVVPEPAAGLLGMLALGGLLRRRR